jgi:hypothetical protein
LDAALGSLIEDLSKMPGKEAGKTMLDETMIILGHEFGRTPDMNLNFGRDHWGASYTRWRTAAYGGHHRGNVPSGGIHPHAGQDRNSRTRHGSRHHRC